MRCPKEVTIDDQIFGGKKTLRRDEGEKWFVYGGIHASGDKLTPVPSFHNGKTAIHNIHITIDKDGDATLDGELVRCKKFHVTFMFGKDQKTSARYEFAERGGSAVPGGNHTGTTLTEIQSSNTYHSNVAPVSGVLRESTVVDKFGTNLGKSLKWNVGELDIVAARIADEFYSQCYY